LSDAPYHCRNATDRINEDDVAAAQREDCIAIRGERAAPNAKVEQRVSIELTADA
jgi:hypothetical protein